MRVRAFSVLVVGVGLLGVLLLASLTQAVAASGSRPHVVHVSTAYVAGLTKGIVPEAPLPHRIDWRAEGEAALAARQAAEVIMQNPAGLELRRMQMITEVGAEQNTMTIIMMPSEFVSAAGALSKLVTPANP